MHNSTLAVRLSQKCMTILVRPSHRTWPWSQKSSSRSRSTTPNTHERNNVMMPTTPRLFPPRLSPNVRISLYMWFRLFENCLLRSTLLANVRTGWYKWVDVRFQCLTHTTQTSRDDVLKGWLFEMIVEQFLQYALRARVLVYRTWQPSAHLRGHFESQEERTNTGVLWRDRPPDTGIALCPWL